MLICVKSDKSYHPSADLHVVYNPDSWEKTKNSIWNPHLISHWPMPGIIPRDQSRQALVENISYVGTRNQLTSELKSTSWKKSLIALNCQWKPIYEPLEWNNYRLF